MSEKPELRAVPIEAETAKYNPEEIRDAKKRQETAQDIGRRKAEIKYDKATPEGRQTLSKEWIKKANLSEAQTKALDEELGLKPESTAKERDEAVKKWQKNNGLEDDGILGWRTLEMMDKKIEEKHLTEGESKAYEQTSNGDEAVENPYATDKAQTGLEYYGSEEHKAEETKAQEKEKEQIKEKEAAAKEEELTKIEGVLNRGEDVSTLGTEYQYEMEGNALSRTDDTNGTTETWNDSRKTWETQEKKEEIDRNNLTEKTKGILEKYGDTTSNEWRKIKSYKLGELDKAGNGDKGIDEDMAVLREQLRPLMEKNPKMAEMTLEQFQQLQEKPEGFATSDLIPKDGTAVRPEEFGLKPDGYAYSYPNANRNTVVARPTGTIEKGKELDQIKVKMGGEESFRTQREFLETRARQIPEGEKFTLPGSPELTYQKTDTGDIQVYRQGNTVGETGPLYTYNAPKNNAPGKWTENNQGNIGQLANADIDFNSGGNTETPETSTASGGIMDGGISFSQR